MFQNWINGMKKRGAMAVAGYLVKKWEIPRQAMRWNQIIEMAVAALVLWVLVQNDNVAKNFGSQIISTMQNTLTQMLTASY